ncbi:uncharacterized protein LOC128194675 [Vigna angularis]|uniref:uncharacterized protein LOC128194675 n=1 Tax=Phaseolus angularis TaxID=3914 RepID=UPI0022B39BF2|nr:uncharacterized protein LOC128194675 [Vigna angularis]
MTLGKGLRHKFVVGASGGLRGGGHNGEEGLRERPDKGKGVARPTKRQRQAPKYVLRVPARLPTTAAGSTSSVGPPPTPIIQPPTPAADPSPPPAAHPSTTRAVDPSPPPAAHPSTIPAADPLPPPTGTPLADPYSSGDGEGLDPPLHDRPWIEPYGKGFIPSRVASQAITRSIKQQFLSPWPTWGAIPDDDRKSFWQRFQMKVQWKPEHESQIHRNFHMKASHRLSEMFRDARNAGQRPNWLGEHIWNSLLAHWNTVEFRNKCVKAQRNRASERGGTLHTGGSITIHEHAIRMAQALGRAVHVDEVFAQTHVRKGTNEFVDERSRKTHEDFSTRLSQVRSEHESAPTPDDASNADDDIRRTQCWIDIVGGKKKGRVYGARQLAANYTASRGGTLKHQPSSSTSTPDEVVLQLRQELHQRDQEIIDLRAEFTNFKALVMRVLPQTSQDVWVAQEMPFL